MKTLKFLAFLCIMLGFAVNTAHSQAVVMTEDQNDGRIPTYWNQWDDNSWHKYISTEWQVVITPSGNINGTFTFYLDIEDPLVPENGVNKISIKWGMKDNEGVMHLTTGEGIITADGILILVAHYKPGKEK